MAGGEGNGVLWLFFPNVEILNTEFIGEIYNIQQMVSTLGLSMWHPVSSCCHTSEPHPVKHLRFSHWGFCFQPPWNIAPGSLCISKPCISSTCKWAQNTDKMPRIWGAICSSLSHPLLTHLSCSTDICGMNKPKKQFHFFQHVFLTPYYLSSTI